MPPKKKTSTDESCSVVFNLLEIGDLEILRRLTPADFDWSSLHPKEDLPPIMFWVTEWLPKVFAAEVAYPVDILEWLLQAGADPMQKAPPSCTLCMTKNNEKNNEMIGLSGQSTVSLLGEYRHYASVANKDQLGRNRQVRFIDEVLSTIAMHAVPKRPRVSVDQAVLERWERMLNATGSHDLTFQTGQGPVTAHAHMLMDASPVLKAMLESSMKEGTTQCIEVKDSSSQGVTLLLQMIYTCSTQDEPSYETFLEALDLAHRWQVTDAVSMIAQALSGMLEPKSFPSIAEAAVLKGLEALKTVCRSFARTSSAVQDELAKGTLPAAVQDLLGKRLDGAALQKSRKRKLF